MTLALIITYKHGICHPFVRGDTGKCKCHLFIVQKCYSLNNQNLFYFKLISNIIIWFRCTYFSLCNLFLYFQSRRIPILYVRFGIFIPYLQFLLRHLLQLSYLTSLQLNHSQNLLSQCPFPSFLFRYQNKDFAFFLFIIFVR